MANVEYITTAIVYPNARVHVGWAWECLGADWLARATRGFGKETYLATGMDEHSFNVQKAAEAKGMSPKAYCDEMAVEIRKVLDEIEIGYDRFIRTSDEDHERVVQHLVQKSLDAGDIYQAKYEGHYCNSCEAFYTEKDLVDGHCPTHKKEAPWVSEDNYFFRLSKYEKPLLDYFESHPDFLQPENRRNEVLNFIKGGLRDFSISRSSFTWGIPLPWAKEHVIYVWFDALVNYLTAAGLELKINGDDGDFEARWPAACHIIGKDISRFHAVYWPAMLMSLGIELPKRIYAHGFINIQGDKMSKSSGNLITPNEVVAWSGVDPFRYYMLAANHFGQDGNFSWEGLLTKCNADLGNDLGNLINRSISMTRKYFPDELLSSLGEADVLKPLRDSFEGLVSELGDAVESIDPSRYIEACMNRSRALNGFISETTPWKLAKDDSAESRAQLKAILYGLLEGIRMLAVCLRPVLVVRGGEIMRQLNVDSPKELGSIRDLSWGEGEFKPGQPEPIYPRLEPQQ